MTETTKDDRGEAVLRVMPRLADINANGHIFGGWVLSQMDIAGGIIAHRLAQGPVATVAIESMKFIAPILLGDIVSVYAREERRGRTSLAIRIDVVATRGIAQEEVPLTSGVYTFVALDADHRPRPFPTAWRFSGRAAHHSDSLPCLSPARLCARSSHCRAAPALLAGA